MKWKVDFQDGGHGWHFGFPIGTILAIFDLQVTPMLPSKFRVIWHLGLGEEAKNRFSRWQPWRPSWISDRNDFSYFWSTSHLMPPAEFRVNWLLGLGEEAKNRFSRWRPWWPSWIYDRHNFSYFSSTSPQCFLPSFESTVLLVQKKKRKIDFQDGCHGGHLGFPIGTILAIFDL